MAFNGLIFIDANQYLELYRVAKGTKLLPALREFADHILVTQQVVDEVCRNKFKFVKSVVEPSILDFDKDRLQQLCHLQVGHEKQEAQFRSLLPEDIENRLTALQKGMARAGADAIERVCKSEDEVSAGLLPLFQKAQQHNQDELARARDRRERGNPPGKREDPLGDQLSWEQLLTKIKGKSQLWLVSADGDYWVTYDKKTYLNPLLHRDLAAVGTIEVFPFKSILDWYNKFPQQAGVKFSKPLTPAETTELQKEYEALPPPPSTRGPFVSATLIPGSGVVPVFVPGSGISSSGLDWLGNSDEVAARMMHAHQQRNARHYLLSGETSTPLPLSTTPTTTPQDENEPPRSSR